MQANFCGLTLPHIQLIVKDGSAGHYLHEFGKVVHYHLHKFITLMQQVRLMLLL